MENSIEVFPQSQNHTSPSLEEYITPPAGMTSPPTKVLSKTDGNTYSSDREMLASNMQQVINEINSKRKRDTTLIVEYKKALNEHTRVAIEAMEDTVQEVCSSTNQVLDAKLNEIYCVLEDIAKLEDELLSFKTAFSDLYKTHIATHQ